MYIPNTAQDIEQDAHWYTIRQATVVNNVFKNMEKNLW